MWFSSWHVTDLLIAIASVTGIFANPTQRRIGFKGGFLPKVSKCSEADGLSQDDYARVYVNDGADMISIFISQLMEEMISYFTCNKYFAYRIKA